MREWVRRIPHMNYGNWGGRTNTHLFNGKEPEAIDAMDQLFKMHDYELRNSNNEDAKKSADLRLYYGLKDVSVEGFYARIYRSGCLIAFKPRGK